MPLIIETYLLIYYLKLKDTDINLNSKVIVCDLE